jgi:UDP-galactopyranose mutase
MKFDFLIIGAGIYGSVCARELRDAGYSCLVIDKRDHIGGNCYTYKQNNTDIHKYGAHIFHTSNKKIWDYVNRFIEFNNYKHHVVANYNNEIYSLPFNMWTFNKFWGVTTPEQAKSIIDSQKFIGNPSNLEEQALSMVGFDIYDKLIKGYTIKQWMTDPKNLPSDIITRLPLRFTYDNNYFHDTYQGIPKNGFTELFEKLLDGSSVELGVDYFDKRNYYDNISKYVIYTGSVDRFYNLEFGMLDYRPLYFEHEILETDNYQGHSVINYTDQKIPYTRIIEHKHFNLTANNNKEKTIISKEYPIKWTGSEEPIYPINNKENNERYNKYIKLNQANNKVFFGGRLAEYRYYDMHQVIGSALSRVKELIQL